MSIDTSQSLEVRRRVAASPSRVYDAWTTAGALIRWFAPSDDYAVIVHRFEPRVGGRYRIEMRHARGASHVVAGEYRELARPSRLVFTWDWEDMPVGDTLVCVEFHPSGDGTEVVLTHSRFGAAPVRDEHAKGWNACLDRLVGVLDAG